MPTTEQLSTALVGRYTIERQIGVGGMATVYLGHDVRHRRPVAVKFLNPELGAVVGAERFASEIELTANLQHPHILPLFDSGEAPLPGYTPGHGLLYYVMPYVDGETLRQRLARERQLSIDKAVRIARGIASALDYAHRRGVIHRDLKPENVLLHEGEPLVADFGIALALSNAAGERITQSGISLGTPQYMSPEQAAADRQLDARSDIYSLGTVLYEMLAGEPPHTGPTVQAVVSKVISEPARPIEQLRHTVPDHVSAALERALAKVPADRFATAGEFAAALTETVPSLRSVARPSRTRRGAWPLLAGLAALGGAAVGAGLAWTMWMRTRGEDPPRIAPAIVRATVNLPAEAPLALGIGIPNVGFSSPLVAISPDGAWLTWVAATSAGRVVFLRDMATGEVRPLQGTQGAIFAFFSPDAKWIGFLTNDHVSKIPRDGGAVVVLTNADAPVLAWWTSHDVIHFSEEEGFTLSRVSADGGARERVAGVSADRDPKPEGFFADVFDGGRFALATLGGKISGDQRDVALLDLTSRRHVTLVQGGYAGRFVAPDHLIFARAGTLYQVRLNSTHERTPGEPVRLLTGSAMESALNVSHAALSINGVLAFVPGSDLNVGRPAWITQSGDVTYLEGLPERVYGVLDLSPNEERLAIEVADAHDYVWIWDFKRREGRKTAAQAVERFPAWSADGRYLTGLTRGRDSVVKTVIHDVEPGGRIGEGRPLEGVKGQVCSWTPNGEIFALEGVPGIGVAFGALNGKVEAGGFPGFFPVFSPDGRWIAFNSYRNGMSDVWLRSFPEGKDGGQLSPEGGMEPRWTPSGNLYYRTGNKWWISHVSTKGTPTWEPPRKVFEVEDFIDTRGWSYDVSNDGQRLLVVKRTRPLQRSKIEIVANWPSLLDQKRQ